MQTSNGWNNLEINMILFSLFGFWEGIEVVSKKISEIPESIKYIGRNSRSRRKVKTKRKKEEKKVEKEG